MSRVGQFFGRLFTGQAGRNQAALRAYGKLPFYAEYRRLEVAPGTPTTFSQWMDEGRLAWARSAPGKAAGTIRASRLLIRLPQTREAVVASVWDSRDSLGRVFPFAFFVVCPLGALGNDPFQCWAAAFAIHATFERFHRELAVLGRGGDFYRLYQKRTVSLRPDDLDERTERLRQEAAAIAADEWFKAVFGDLDPVPWFSSLLRRAERWKSEPASVPDLALSCPLAGGSAPEAQALLWLSWLSAPVRKARKTPWLVMPAETDHHAAVHILVRDLLPNDFQLLTTDAANYGYVENLAQVLPAGPLTADLSVADSEPGDSAPADSAAPDSSVDTPPTGPLLDWLAEHAP
jgi:hypothetical protein